MKCLQDFGRWLIANADPLNKWAQIIAMIVAGWWAYTRFDVIERPGLELYAKTSGHIQISGNEKDFIATYTVQVENAGKRSFAIKSVRIRGWLSPEPALGKRAVLFMDQGKTESSRPFFDRTFDSDNITRHFSPGQIAFQSYQWLLRDSGRIHFRADFVPQQTEMAIHHIYHHVVFRRSMNSVPASQSPPTQN